MQIEITEMGSEAFYKEVVNVAMQYRTIKKNHKAKLKDYFKKIPVQLILAAAVIIFAVLNRGQSSLDKAILFSVAVLFVWCIVFGAGLISMNKAYKAMMADRHTSVLTLDEDGVELDVKDKKTIRHAWNSIIVVREFRESISFIPGEGGIIISVDRRYAEAIRTWLAENRPETEIV